MSSPHEIPATTLAEHHGLVSRGLPLRTQVPLTLDHLSQPHQLRWFDYAQDYLDQEDIPTRLMVIKRLPDAITDRRQASVNCQGPSRLLALLDEIQERQPPEIQIKAAEWTGLLAIRNTLDGAYEELRVRAGKEQWPIKGWPYRANVRRSAQWINGMLRNKDLKIQHSAQLSVKRWTRRIIH